MLSGENFASEEPQSVNRVVVTTNRSVACAWATFSTPRSMATKNPDNSVAMATGTATAPAIAVVRVWSVRSPVNAIARTALCARSG